MFSDLPTPGYHQTSFQSYGGMTPMQPSYAQYQMAPQGEGGYGSLNDALRSPGLPKSPAPAPYPPQQPQQHQSTPRSKRRESGMGLLSATGFGGPHRKSSSSCTVRHWYSSSALIMADYLRKLAQKLGTEGPIKTLSTPRAVKLLHNGQYFLATTNARYVWEIPPYPQFYVPATELRAEAEKAGSCLEIKEGEEFYAPDSENAASSSEAQTKNEPLAKQWILTINNSEGPKKTIDQAIAFSPSLSSSSQTTAKDLAGLVK
ncbi:hypothetical protein KC322_g17172, partial [Hortaea werneckii]